MFLVRARRLLLPALLAATWATPALADRPEAENGTGIGYFDVHRTLGAVALGALASSLVIASASGNLGRLMDADRCCPDGGDRQQLWRTVDRSLVTTGIIAYSGAAALASYNLVFRDPPGEANRRVGHQAHRWLALGHGVAFLTSAITGYIMFRSQPSNPERFATAARVHTASNVLLVPLLTAAMSNILFE